MNKAIFLFALIIPALAVSAAYCAGQGGLDIAALQAGVGARPLGMGGAFVSVADNADAGYWNPAGLSGVTSHEITTMQTKLSTDVDHYYVSYATKLFKGTIGISWIQISLGNISRTTTTDAFNEVITTSIFSYFSNAYLFSYGLPINPNVAIGLTAKYLASDMVDVAQGQAYGYSVTPGILIKPKEKISIGAKLDELLNEQKWGTGTIEKVPPKARLGISFSDLFQKDSRVALDVSQVLKSTHSTEYALGYEMNFKNILLRAGIVDSGLTAGAGFASGIAALDYAYVQQSSLSRNNVHRISLSGKW